MKTYAVEINKLTSALLHSSGGQKSRVYPWAEARVSTEHYTLPLAIPVATSIF